jgi:TRAP-type C4-dicarboxylate transport system substrate-binding protein
MTRFSAALILALFAAAPAQGAPAEIRLALFLPTGAPVVEKAYRPWIERVNRAARGAVAIVWRAGEEPGTPTTIYRSIVGGQVDAGRLTGAAAPVKLRPLAYAASPSLADGPEDRAEHGSVALWRTYEKGGFAASFDDTKPLALVTLPPYRVFARNPVRTLDELRNKRILAAGHVRYLRSLGATAVIIPSADIAMVMGRGVIDGASLTWEGFAAPGLADTAKHALEGPFGNGQEYLLIGAKALAALPEAGRAALLAESGEGLSRAIGRVHNEVALVSRAQAVRAGMAVARLREDDLRRANAAYGPIFLAEMGADPDARRVIAIFRGELERARAGR